MQAGPGYALRRPRRRKVFGRQRISATNRRLKPQSRYRDWRMPRAIYQVRLVVKPEYEAEFNAWYEGTYMPKLMRETPHFTAAHRYMADFNGERLYVTEYETTTET